MYHYISFLVYYPIGEVTILTDKTVYIEQDNASFICSSNGGPENSFQWFKNDVAITTVTTDTTNTNILNLFNVTALSDGAMYTCVVNNSAGADNASVSLNIAPIIIEAPTNIYTEYGTTVSFMCQATAYPEPTYQWIRVGGALPVSAVGENSSILTISPIYFEDEGFYQCTATSNEIALVSTPAFLLSEFCNPNVNVYIYNYTICHF